MASRIRFIATLDALGLPPRLASRAGGPWRHARRLGPRYASDPGRLERVRRAAE